MADEQTQTTETQSQQDVPQTPPAPAEAVNTESGSVSQMVPKDRFNEVNEKAKAEAARAEKAEKELVKFREAQAKAEREAAEKRGEFEQLYKSEQEKASTLASQLETVTAELTQLRALFAAQLDKRKQALPDHIKPLLDHMDAVAALKYLDENAEKFEPDAGARKQLAPPMHGAEGIRRGDKQPLFNVGRVKL